MPHAIMNERSQCPVCGKDLLPGALAAECPYCLMALGLGLPEEVGSGPGPGQDPAQGQTSLTSTSFGDYELLEEIGRGGMGVVYKARQLSLNRIVAVKLILAGQFAEAKAIQRFRGEAMAAAVLRHPNIIGIYEIGLHAEKHFFSMEYVEGQNLAQLVGNRPLPAKKAARYMKLLAQAIQYAHEQGVLHRDLKPTNVLVESATDEPRLTDFGLAKRLDSESSLTVTGQMMGSPHFMPPEQASPGHGRVGRQSDVYGLGAILYYLLTARAPFQAESLPMLAAEVMNTEPVPPRRLNPGVPRDLETICLKCLEKEPVRRFANAQELADDLGRFLADEPVQARPITSADKLWRWCRRKPAIAGLVAALNLALALGLTGVLWEWRRAVAGELSARGHQYVSDMNLAQQVWQEGNSERAQALLRAHIPKPGQPDMRGFEWRFLWKLCQQDDSRSILTNFEVGIGGLACSPDGKRLAVAAGRSLKVIEVASLREALELKDPDLSSWVHCVAWSPVAPHLLATADSRGLLKLWDTTTAEVTVLDRQPPGKTPAGEVQSIAFSPDGKMLAAGFGGFYAPEGLQVWDVESKKKIWSGTNIISAVTVTFTRDSKALISGGGDSGNPILWDATSGKQLARFPARHSSWMCCAVLSADGVTLATAAADNRIILWDFSEQRAKATLESPGVDVVALSPDGRLIASAGDDGLIRVCKGVGS